MDVMSDHPVESEGLTQETFAAFYRREWRDVVGLAYVLTGDRWVAEELAQEGFVAACRRWDQVGQMDKPGACVRRVVVNQSVSRFRRRTAERRALVRMGEPEDAASSTIDDQSAEVWAAVRQLPRRQGQVIALVYFDGMSVAETGRVIGCSRETAKTHLKRGRKALAARLGVEDADA